MNIEQWHRGMATAINERSMVVALRLQENNGKRVVPLGRPLFGNRPMYSMFKIFTFKF
jgi:hypothetical protein